MLNTYDFLAQFSKNTLLNFIVVAKTQFKDGGRGHCTAREAVLPWLHSRKLPEAAALRGRECVFFFLFF